MREPFLVCWKRNTPCSGVGTGGARGAQARPSFYKCPFSGGKVPFAFVKNVVQIAFLPQWPLIYDCIYFFSPPPPPTPTFPGKILGALYDCFLFPPPSHQHFLFILKVPSKPPPPTFWRFLRPCTPWFTKFEFEYFFPFILRYGYSRNLGSYIRNLDISNIWYHELFCEIESDFKSVQFF
jgi:hypothetical protein